MLLDLPQRCAGRFALFAAGMALAACPVAVARAHDEGVQAELRIADIRLRERQVLLADAILYENEAGGLLVPFAPLMQALGLQLEATAQGGITGWFLRESQQLIADPRTERVRVAGREFALEPGDLVMIEGELHIATTALDRWLALGARWDAAAQTLSLTPPFLLPAEERAARERLAARGGGGGEAIDTAGFVAVSAPWEPIGWPHLNLNLALTYDESSGGVIAQGNALAEGDLLWATGRLALAGSTQGNLDARLTLARQDPQGLLLGPARATIVEAGDIAVAANPLLQRNLFGVGLRIGREPISAVGEFDRSDLIGDAPPGWQAELYRDSELLGFQTVASDGRYFFPQVPVLFGLNRFRIVFYGPSGERQEQARTVDIGSSLIRPGEVRYNLVAMKQGYALFGGRTEPNPAIGTEGSDSAASPAGFQLAATYFEARAAYGLTRRLGVSGFAAWRALDGGGPALGYAGLGTAARLGGVLTALDGVIQQDGAIAARASIAAGIDRFSLNAAHERFDTGFISEDSGPERGGIAQRTLAGIDGRFGGIGLGLGVSLADFRNGGGDRTVNLRANAALAGFSLANTLLWRDFRSAPQQPAQERFDGQFAASGSLGRLRLRTGVDYTILPQWQLRRMRGEVSYRLGAWFLALTADRDMETRAGQWGLVTSRDWNGIRLGTDIRYDDARGDWRGLMTLALALDRDPLGRGLRAGRKATSQRGSLIARGFRDSNANGRRDADEALLDGLEIRLDPRGRLARGDGPILAEELPLDRPVALAPVIAAIEDPFLVPAAPGYLVTARAGRAVRVDVPLIESGEVVAVMPSGEGSQDQSGTIAELVSCATGAAVRRERVAFDGQAFFAGVLPGCYELRAGAGAVRIDVTGGEVVRVEVPGE